MARYLKMRRPGDREFPAEPLVLPRKWWRSTTARTRSIEIGARTVELVDRQACTTEEEIQTRRNWGATIIGDYSFRRKEEQEDDLIPVLLAYDNVKEGIWTFYVEEKGISNASVAVDWLVGRLDT